MRSLKQFDFKDMQVMFIIMEWSRKYSSNEPKRNYARKLLELKLYDLAKI